MYINLCIGRNFAGSIQGRINWQTVGDKDLQVYPNPIWFCLRLLPLLVLCRSVSISLLSGQPTIPKIYIWQVFTMRDCSTSKKIKKLREGLWLGLGKVPTPGLVDYNDLWSEGPSRPLLSWPVLCCAQSLSHVRLCDPMDCSPPGCSVHGDSPGKNTGVGCYFLLPGDLPDTEIKLASLVLDDHLRSSKLA